MQALAEGWQILLAGFWVTIQLFVIAGIGAFILGALVLIMRISPVGSLRIFATVYTEVFRNTPLTLVLFSTAFVLSYLGFSFPGVDSQTNYFLLALLGLSLYTSPFVAEALRSGVNGVAIGQAEAARSIGLGFGQSLQLVILPQAMRMVIPPLINVYIALVKNTSVAGGFAVIEMIASSRSLINSYGNSTIPILLAVAALYLAVTIPLGFLAGQAEKKLAMQR